MNLVLLKVFFPRLKERPAVAKLGFEKDDYRLALRLNASGSSGRALGVSNWALGVSEGTIIFYWLVSIFMLYF